MDDEGQNSSIMREGVEGNCVKLDTLSPTIPLLCAAVKDEKPENNKKWQPWQQVSG